MKWEVQTNIFSNLYTARFNYKGAYMCTITSSYDNKLKIIKQYELKYNKQLPLLPVLDSFRTTNKTTYHFFKRVTPLKLLNEKFKEVINKMNLMKTLMQIVEFNCLCNNEYFIIDESNIFYENDEFFFIPNAIITEYKHPIESINMIIILFRNLGFDIKKLIKPNMGFHQILDEFH